MTSVRVAFLGFVFAFLGSSTFAQTYPNRPIRLIIPYPAGGSTDIMARALQEPIARILGQQLIIENRAGAAGTTGANEVARSDPDGYTLLFANNGPISVAPLLQKGVGFDAMKSFAPVSLVSKAPLVLVVNQKVPAKTTAELIAYARGREKELLYASAGPGSLGHLSTERFLSQTGLKMVHVPYRGQAPTTLAIFAGEVDMLMTTASDTMNEYIKQGSIRLLGVSSAEESPVAPGAPPIGNSVSGFAVETWFGILAPAGTPAAIVARLNAAFKEALAEPALRERFLGYGVEATSSSPESFGAIIAAEIPAWRKVIDERNVKVD